MRTLTLIFCPLLAFAQTPDQDWRFAHPGATMVGGIRVEALLQSPILNMVIEQATAKDPAMSAMAGLMKGTLGGVSEVRISILDLGDGKDPEVLTLVTGKLDDAAASALAQGKATVHRVDANTLLLGEAASVAEAVQRMEEPRKVLQSRAVQRGKALANYDFWIAGTLPAIPMTGGLDEMLNGIALGLSVRDDLQVELALDTPSAEMAEELIRKARQAQREQPDFPAALLTDVDDTTARFRISVEKSVLVQRLQEVVGSPIPKFKEKEPERKTVTIYGLEGGAREIAPSASR